MEDRGREQTREAAAIAPVARRMTDHSCTYEESRNKIQKAILADMDYSEETSDEQLLDMIDERILSYQKESRQNDGSEGQGESGDGEENKETAGAQGSRQLSLAEMKKLRMDIFYSMRKLDILQDLLDSPGITEIMINGEKDIFIEKNGKTQKAPLAFSSKEKLENVIQQVVASCNRVVNASSPIVDARLQDGSRVNVVLPPVALNGPIVTIRRFPDKPIRMDDLIRFGSITEEIAGFLSRLVRARYNIFISGGTGSGKTTFLNALSDYIPSGERIITIEDNAELQIRHIPNLVRLEARNKNVEGCVPITIRDLIKASLRMRPDRIIVGEVRGGEAIDMVQAMNTGHDGSMSTGHANSARDMIARLETMILMGIELPIPAIRSQLAAGIDIIVHLGRLRDGTRKMLEIAEVHGVENNEVVLRTLYRFREEGEENGKVKGDWEQVNPLADTFKLARAGISEEGRER